MKISLCYIITSGENEAHTLGQSAVRARLAACANILPAHSLYMWEKELKDDLECVLLLKTIPELQEKLTTFIQSLHSYRVPCILHWQVEANEAYGQWVRDEVVAG